LPYHEIEITVKRKKNNAAKVMKRKDVEEASNEEGKKLSLKKERERERKKERNQKEKELVHFFT